MVSIGFVSTTGVTVTSFFATKGVTKALFVSKKIGSTDTF